MNEAQLRGFRLLAGTASPPGEYAVVDQHKRLIMGWLTKTRAEQYTVYYPGATVIRMVDLNQRSA